MEHAKGLPVIHLPCCIGDEVWGIRTWRTYHLPTKGIVSEMYFVGREMQLCVVVKNIVHGIWGVTVFATEEEAIKKAEELSHEK
jgi:hypothetical protein